jgi:DNA topoisomerase-3
VAKALIITEKPSVARDIAAAVGGFEENEDYFENDAYALTWAVGHLFELLEPEEIDDAYKRWTLDTLPIIPETFQLKPKTRQRDRIRAIKSLLEREDVDRIINACDAGREGELIFREIVQYFRSEKPVHRLWLQSMTEDAIRSGLSDLRPGLELEGLGAAAECRAFTDWLIGMNATRALTKRLRGRRERGAWSAGRVQTPTLALLVARELEVLSHQPVPYWRLLAQFEHGGHGYEGVWFDPGFRANDDAPHARDDRIFEEAPAREILEAAQGQAGSAEETRKPSKESAPRLFDLTSLQREANSRLGWSARRALSAAQRCYEGHKILTYPRTDSRCLPDDYRETVQNSLRSLSLAKDDVSDTPLGAYAAAARHLLEAGLENEGRTFDGAKVSDHHAIIPTGKLPPRDLSGDDKRLFDLVTRRFLANFHPPATWERVERVTEVAGHRFRSRSRTLVEPGWRTIGDPNVGDEESALPALRPGQSEASGVPVQNRGVELEANQTKPPPRITEARLLSLMENAGKQIEDEELAEALSERGLGTPATRAEVIENLIAKEYAVRLGKAIRPTAKGIRLIDILGRVNIDRLASAELTGEIEHHLHQVEDGERSASAFMGEMEQYTREIVEIAKTFEYTDLYKDDPPLGKCPLCERPVFESAWFYRCEELPEEEEDCPARIWKDTSGRYLDRGTVEVLLRDGNTGVLEGFTARNGRTYQGVLEFDRDEKKMVVRPTGWEEGSINADPEYEVNPDPLGTCPFEEECKVVESPTHYVCERKLKESDLEKDAAEKDASGKDASESGEERPKSCGFNFPRTVCKREIVRDEALVYLGAGRTDLLTDFTSRFGRPFSATLVLKKNGRHGFEFPPRAPKGDGDAGGRKKAGRKKAGGKKKTTTKKKTTRRKKTAAKKKTTAKKKAASKKSTGKKTADGASS